MSFEKYYRDELDYLRQLGREAALERPHLASFLSEQGTDPDVERLLEGFAFLTGKLREKIDDQFPELTHGMLNMLWPNYLRPVPSMTVLQYQLAESAITEATLMASGNTVLSIPVGQSRSADSEEEKNTQCKFTLCRDIWLFPLDIQDISVNNSNEQSMLGIHFSARAALNLKDLQLGKLRFYLGDDQYTRTQLYFWLTYYFERAELKVNDLTIPLPDLDFTPVGFEREDALLPYPKNAYAGYRILQEYYCFPEGFLFLDVTGMIDFPPELNASEFTLNLYFSQPFTAEMKIRPDTLRLNCTPAVNLFSHDSEAIEMTGTRAEYLLSGSYSRPDHYEIFSVDRVEGRLSEEGKNKGRSRAEGRVYPAFESFHHQIEKAQKNDTRYYRLRVKNSPFRQGFEHFLSFVRSDESELALTGENISISMTALLNKSDFG